VSASNNVKQLRQQNTQSDATTANQREASDVATKQVKRKPLSRRSSAHSINSVKSNTSSSKDKQQATLALAAAAG
jgi:hypothetical protein